MNILFLNHNLAGRGSYFRCLGFARELVKLGHHTDLWTVSNDVNLFGQTILTGNVRVWHTPRWGKPGKHDGGYAPADIVSRWLKVHRQHWDVIHAFEHRPNVLVPWVWSKLLSKVLFQNTLYLSDWSDWWTAGGIITSKRKFMWMDRLEQAIEEKSKTCSHGVTVISQSLYDRAVAAGVDKDHLLLLPSGAQVEHFPLLDKNKCRQQLRLPLDRPLIGFAGFSLWDMKLLSETFALVQNQIPHACLMVVGGGVEAQSMDIFKQKFSVGQDVFLPGVVSYGQLPTYLCACDMHILPLEDTTANRARLPNKLLDYYASGRPVVAADIGDTGKFIKEHQTGIAAGLGAPSMAKGCCELLKNSGLADALGQNARRIIEQKLNYTNLTQTLLGFYERCAHSSFE